MPEYKVTKYDKATGEGRGTISGSLSSFLADVNTSIENIVEGEWDAEIFWFPEGQPTKRPVLCEEDQFIIVADGVQEIVIRDLPVSTKVNIWNLGSKEATDAVVDDGTLEWSTAHPGRYILTLLPPFPARRFQCPVTALSPIEENADEAA